MDNGWEMFAVDTEFKFGLMEPNTRVCGKMEKRTDKV